GGVAGAGHVRPGAEDLAELDERRAEPLQRRGDAPAAQRLDGVPFEAPRADARPGVADRREGEDERDAEEAEGEPEEAHAPRTLVQLRFGRAVVARLT